MRYHFLIIEAIQALRSNLLRSLLTIIGIVVGIFSVTAMLALGAGLSSNVLDRFSSFAQGDLTVSGDLTYMDLSWISERPYVEHVLGARTAGNTDVVAFEEDFSPTIQMVLGDYTDVQKYTVVSGETYDFNDREYAEHVAVVSNGFADRVTEETNQSVLGSTISIAGIPYRVIGVIKSTSFTFTRGDGLVLVPYGSAVGNIFNTKNFTSVAVLLGDSSYFSVAGQDIVSGLNASEQLALDSKDAYTVETAQSIIESAQQTTTMLSLFLGLVGGIALFVGGIGTMNMMLTTVTERTKEIGLRKAIGARNRDIMLQILIESVLLTTIGGAIGIALSLVAARIANVIFAESEIIKVLVNVQVVLLAAVVSVLVGLIFGLYPARNAARLQPVDALRAE